MLDFEQVYNISEGNFGQAASNFKVQDILDQIAAVTDADFKKRHVELTTAVEDSAPASIRASHLIFRQVLLNLLGSAVAGSVRAQVSIVASGTDAGGKGKNLTVEIKNSRNEYNKEQCLQIEELCLEEELVRILEAGQSVDVNLIIALILSRQLGWPVDFVNEGAACSFILIVPASAYSPGSIEVEKLDPAAGTTDGLVAHPPLRKPPTVDVEQMHRDAAEITPDDFAEPTAPVSEHPECLLVSCSDLVPLFERGLGFKCDESFLEESAINAVGRAIKKNQPYKFVFVDLDDPTLLLGRFMVAVNKLIEETPGLKIDVYACASSSSERMLKKCKEVKVTFIAKPMTVEKVKHLVPLYKQ